MDCGRGLPGQGAGRTGSPSQLLPTLLPGQFAIVSVQLFQVFNMAPFVVLAGGDWGRGTITGNGARARAQAAR